MYKFSHLNALFYVDQYTEKYYSGITALRIHIIGYIYFFFLGGKSFIRRFGRMHLL